MLDNMHTDMRLRNSIKYNLFTWAQIEECTTGKSDLFVQVNAAEFSNSDRNSEYPTPFQVQPQLHEIS